MEIEMLQERYPRRTWERLERLFNRAVNWWHEYEEWKSFPWEGTLYDQPKEWIDSVSCVRAARSHYERWVKTPPQQIGEEGETGRGAIGD